MLSYGCGERTSGLLEPSQGGGAAPASAVLVPAVMRTRPHYRVRAYAIPIAAAELTAQIKPVPPAYC
jgi:hypothetical protein